MAANDNVDKVDKLTYRAQINTTASLATMADDSVPGRYNLRTRPATSTSPAVARSTPQQKRQPRSRRAPAALLNPITPTPPSLPSPQVARIPYLPPEIVARILSHYCIHDKPVTLLPTRELVDAVEALNERMPFLPRTGPHKPSVNGVLGPFAVSTTNVPITPPFQSHKAPVIDLLLTSRMFHDEFIKQFYSKNIFTFLAGDHEEVWRQTSDSKRAHVRHIQLESLWELDINFLEFDHNTHQAKATFSVKPVWGRSEIEMLMDLGDGITMFPNLESIAQKIRLRFNKNWVRPIPNVPNILITLDGYDFVAFSTLNRQFDLMVYEDAREYAKIMVVIAIHERWERLKTQAYLEKMEIGFMFSETEEWDEKVPMVPITSPVQA